MPAHPPAPLKVQLLGSFQVSVNGRTIPPLRSRKGQWLLGLLVLRHGGQVRREWLAEQLWPDSPKQEALTSLRQSLADLKKALGEEAGRLGPPGAPTLCLDLAGPEVDVDVLAFDEAAARSDTPSLERAIALYRGPLLEECDAELVLPEREARREAYLRARETLAERALALGDLAAAEDHWRQAVAADPLPEGAYCRLMEVLAARGEYAAAGQAYHDLCRALHRQLDAEPSTEARALFRQIRERARRQARSRTSAGAGPTPPRQASVPGFIPAPLTRFVDREEVGEIEERLGTARLVTLTGAGGIGKTRLAIEVGRAAACGYADGAWFVDLAPLAGPALIPQAVAAVLGVREEPNRPLSETLAGVLRGRQLLLILDNCEHLLEGSPGCVHFVHRWLEHCPRLRVLATSRETLGLTGEVAWRVPPMEHETAVRLFMERAREAEPGFEGTPEEVEVVSQICRRLDGIPLAIELAAARVKVLTVEQIAAGLDHCLELLRSGSPAPVPRHRSLQATLDWSYRLLTPAEQTLLARLSVFAGGWTLEAAASLGDCGAQRAPGIANWGTPGIETLAASAPQRDSDPEGNPSMAETGSGGGYSQSAIRPLRSNHPQSAIGTPQSAILDLLASLVQKSLVIKENQSGAARYRLLDTVRQYADEALTAGERDAVRRRHLDFYLGLAEEAEREGKGAGQPAAAQRVDEEHENLRAALAWCLLEKDEGGRMKDEPDPLHPFGLRLAGAVAWFWGLRGHLQEGEEHLRKLLERADEGVPAPVRARALSGRGHLLYLQGDYGRARYCFEEALAIARHLGDLAGMAETLGRLGHVARSEGDLRQAESLCEEGLRLSRQAGDPWGIAEALHNLGLIAMDRRDEPRARRLYAESLALRRRLADRRGTADTLSNLGILAVERRDCPRARALLEESLALARELGDQKRIADTLYTMARLAVIEGDDASGRRLHEETLARRRELGDRRHIGDSLYSLGEVAIAQADYDAARRFHDESLTLRRELGKGQDLALSLHAVAMLAMSQGDREWARSLLEESLVIRRERGDRWGIGEALHGLGRIAAEEGDYAQARALYAESLAIRREHGYSGGISTSVASLAALALAQDRGACHEGRRARQGAVRLLAAVGTLLEDPTIHLPPHEQDYYDRQVARARAALGEEVFAREWAAGRAMVLEEAVARALEEDPRPAAQSRTSVQRE
jgi:predicted ATPase/DNA-binding SARP family transcriptional activator